MNGNGLLITVYVIYAATSIGLTFWLARTLFHNGAVFLEDVFEDHPALAAPVNRLLVVGFYMLNLGYAFLLLQANEATSALHASELLVRKLGILLVSFGLIHFGNMALFWHIRQRHQLDDAPPPVGPQGFTSPPFAAQQPWATPQQ